MHPDCRETEQSTAESRREGRAPEETGSSPRKEKLLPLHHQVAIQFADLHDTPSRIEEMGVITLCLHFVIRFLIP